MVAPQFCRFMNWLFSAHTEMIRIQRRTQPKAIHMELMFKQDGQFINRQQIFLWSVGSPFVENIGSLFLKNAIESEC